jgi:hypothetical protein
MFLIKDYWEKYGFTILAILSILFIVFMAVFINKKGSYTDFNTNTFNKMLSYYVTTTKNPNLSRGLFKKPMSSTPYQSTPYQSTQKKGDSKLEITTRNALENIFKKPFPKIRPDFLRNPVTGGNFNLELDCFNRDLMLGVEINGAQHYKYIPYFHKNYEAFLNQKYRDELKKHMCKDNGIKLIEVPYTVKEHEIYDFLVPRIKNLGFNI